VCVTDFSDVARQMKSSQADLILLDINLPLVNGEDLLQEFRKNRDTPVIMLTSRTNEIDEALSISFGADDYITKPYNPTILLLRISAILKRCAKAEFGASYRDVQVNTREKLLPVTN
jgi:DNA-binding response OmpR family regulator